VILPHNLNQDSIGWEINLSGEYSARSAWVSSEWERQKVEGHKLIWSSFHIPGHYVYSLARYLAVLNNQGLVKPKEVELFILWFPLR
jgi:hypothetical protein